MTHTVHEESYIFLTALVSVDGAVFIHLGLDRRGHFSAYLIIYIGISIEMIAGKSEFLSRFHIERLIACRIHNLHLLSQVVIEVIVGLVAPFLLSAAEYVDVITALIAGLHDGCSTLLLCLYFRLNEAYCSEVILPRFPAFASDSF